ncbi:unnamed protein product [Sphagnum balticum]
MVVKTDDVRTVQIVHDCELVVDGEFVALFEYLLDGVVAHSRLMYSFVDHTEGALADLSQNEIGEGILGPTHDRVLTEKAELVGEEAHIHVAVGVAHDVGQIADMSVLAGEAAVGLVEGIVMCTGGGTAVGEVTELVDVDTVFGDGGEPSNCSRYVHERIFTRLLESYESSNSRVAWIENADCV